MLWLQRGDKVPTVAMVQSVLNQAPGKKANLKVDGHFGKATYNRVVDFQKWREIGDDGVVGPKTWQYLSTFSNYQVIDVIDGMPDKSFLDIAHDTLLRVGSNAIMTVYLENAAKNLITKIRKRVASSSRKIGLLRIFGHGKKGTQALSIGVGGYYDVRGGTLLAGTGEIRGGRRVPVPYGVQEGRGLSYKKMEDALKFMREIKPFFGSLGSLELHGCKVAEGQIGKSFVGRLSLMLQSPVSAQIGKSKVGASSDPKYRAWASKLTLRLENPYFTFYPWGLDLKSWAESKD